MKEIITLIFIAGTLFSCVPNAQEKAQEQKVLEDSVVNAVKAENAKEKKSEIENKISELQSKIKKAQNEIDSLNTDPQYIYNKSRLATVRTRVSTGASYGWIDKNGTFWSGKDANQEFDAAAAHEKDILEKINSNNEEIKTMQDKINDLQGLISK